MNTEKDLEYLLREGIIQTQADLDDYLKLHSTKTTRKGKSTAARTREYAMKLSDIQAQLGGITGLTTSTLGMSVTDNGDGTWSVDYAGGSGAINYSNVYFVDPVNGNDGTALAGRFDKPFNSIGYAINVAGATAPSATARALVYVRKGYYSGWNIGLQNNVDIYCEDGTVFSGYWRWADNGATVNCNIRGKAIYEGMTTNVLYVTGTSNINFEFNYIYASFSSPIYIQPAGQSTINIEGDAIYATTLGVGYALAFRGACDVTLNIRKWINSSHGCIDIRASFSGKLVVNCPKIILNATNYYGGNYKQGIIVYSATNTASIVINGDFINEMPAFIGGIAGMITFWGSAGCYLEFNGKIYGGQTYGLYASGNSTDGRMVINGSIESDIQPVWVSSYTNCYVRNGVVIKRSTAAGAPVALNQFAKLFMNNCFIYNGQTDGDCINIVDTTNDVNLYNVVGQSEGAAGYGITSANPVNVRVHNSRFNKDKNATITDILSPSGYIKDNNVIVPKY